MCIELNNFWEYVLHIGTTLIWGLFHCNKHLGFSIFTKTTNLKRKECNLTAVCDFTDLCTHFTVWVVLIIEDPTVTVKFRTPIKSDVSLI